MFIALPDTEPLQVAPSRALPVELVTIDEFTNLRDIPQPEPTPEPPAEEIAEPEPEPIPELPPEPLPEPAPAPEVLPPVRTVPVVPVRPAETVVGSSSGNYVVQIAAFRDLRQAEGEFDKLRAAYPGLMSGLVRDVQRADLGARGIYYRLRVGWFENGDAAKSLSDRLKAQGQDCIVRPK